MSRFKQVLRWELLLSKRQIATMALTFFGLVVIPQILTLVFKSSSSSAYTMGILCSVALSAYLLCSGALIFSSLRSRQQRINNFMLDAAQWATSALTEGLNNGNGIFHFYTNLNGDPSPVEGFLVILLGTITQHACFLLFGSIYHKHPLVMAVLTWMGLGIALLMLGALAANLLSEFINSGYTIILYDAWWKALYFVVSIALIIFCYWFAFRRYTRLQVINNQWINK